MTDTKKIENVYQKMVKIRAELQKADIKKSGQNTFTKAKYYELSDFLPKVNELNNKYGVCTKFNLTDNNCSLILVNTENPEEGMTFNIPTAEAGLKGGTPIQNLGAKITYLRRYLLMTAYEIAEGDIVDTQPETKKALQLSNEELQMIRTTKDIDKLSEVCKKMVAQKGNSYRNEILKEYNTQKQVIESEEK